MDVKKLIREAKKGNQMAFKKLFDAYWNDVFKYQKSLIYNTNEAEDIAIETFAKAFEKIHTFDEGYNFKNWLIKISKNVYIDRSRKKESKKKTTDINTYQGELLILSEPDEEDHIILEQKLNAIKEAMKTLKPKYREILELRYFKDMPYKQIAEETGESISNVKIRLMRAKKLLAEKLKNYE